MFFYKETHAPYFTHHKSKCLWGAMFFVAWILFRISLIKNSTCGFWRQTMDEFTPVNYCRGFAVVFRERSCQNKIKHNLAVSILKWICKMFIYYRIEMDDCGTMMMHMFKLVNISLAWLNVTFALPDSKY